MALTQSEVSGIMREVNLMNNNDGSVATPNTRDGQDMQQLEGFIVSVMRNFFLDLSVD